MYYVIKERLAAQLDPRNKRTHYFNLFIVSVMATGAAFIALPTPDTSHTPTPPTQTVTLAVQANTQPKESLEEKRASNLRACKSDLEEKAVQCRIKKDNKTCQKWMDQITTCKQYE